MLLNLSNHKYKTWSPAQLEAAKQQFTKVKDYSFPAIPPYWDNKQVKEKAVTILDKIREQYKMECDHKKLCILLNGEQTFIIHFYMLCKKNKIPCYVATAKRNSTMNQDGSETKKFIFHSFRKII